MYNDDHFQTRKIDTLYNFLIILRRTFITSKMRGKIFCKFYIYIKVNRKVKQDPSLMQ